MCDYLYIHLWSIIGITISLFGLIFAFMANKNAKKADKKAKDILNKISVDTNKISVDTEIIKNRLEQRALEIAKSTPSGVELKPEDRKIIENYENITPQTAKEWFLKGYAAYKNKDYDKAIENYEKATLLDSEFAVVFYNWGNVLLDLAEMKQDKTLFKQANKKYEKATQINPEYVKSFNNWGLSLFYLAKMKQDKNLFEQAIKKYERATQINPKHASAFSNWGLALFFLAKMKHDENFIKEGLEKCKRAYKLNSKNSYNLSCGYALLGEKRKALHHLEENFENRQFDVDYVLNDEDWKNYLTDDDFIHLINKYK